MSRKLRSVRMNNSMNSLKQQSVGIARYFAAADLQSPSTRKRSGKNNLREIRN
jgi:hypothetical protein